MHVLNNILMYVCMCIYGCIYVCVYDCEYNAKQGMPITYPCIALVSSGFFLGHRMIQCQWIKWSCLHPQRPALRSRDPMP